MKPAGANLGECTRGPDVRHIGCGGQIAPTGQLFDVVDFGMGFHGKKFKVNRKFSRKPTGYSGFCMKCGKEGAFKFQGKG